MAMSCRFENAGWELSGLSLVFGLLHCSASDSASDATSRTGAGAAAFAGGSAVLPANGGSSAGAAPSSSGGATAGGAGSPASSGGGAIAGAAGSTSGAASSSAGGDGDPVAGSAGTAGASAPAPYAPCPPAGMPCVILPVGDSITYGYDSTTGGGYRLRLLHDIWAAKHDATFVGDSSSGPDTLDGKPFPKRNEGFSGYTIDDAPMLNRSGISPLVPAALAKYEPHIVTLMIGTNDVGTNDDLANAPTRLGKLIDTITSTSPNALLVVAQITPIADDTSNARVQTYNAAIPALLKSRISAGKHIILVDMYAAFTAHAAWRTDYMNGSLHPNDTGYDLMGDTWFQALAPHL